VPPTVIDFRARVAAVYINSLVWLVTEEGLSRKPEAIPQRARVFDLDQGQLFHGTTRTRSSRVASGVRAEELARPVVSRGLLGSDEYVARDARC
jgi:hypothetical protein